ncbi:MAG: thioredoxin-dependent thiol peroxidase [bacterium]|nr:thioredoxin-dependent thiol peroxidase [bacterium]
MAALKEGNKVPDFTLSDAQGNKVKLSDFKGKKVILYFYPRDNTPGCTQEACDFRDRNRDFERANTHIIGVSPDTTKSHQGFLSKHGLPFTLLSDPDKKVAAKYGVFKEKKMYGKTVMGIERSTFLIDEGGKLVKEMRKIKVKGHADQLLDMVQK